MPALVPKRSSEHGERDDDGSNRHGHAGNGHAWDGAFDDGDALRDADGPELPDGAALHDEDGKVHRRHEDHLLVRRSDGLQHDAKPVHDAARRHVLVLLHVERNGGLHLQLYDGHVPLRNDQGRLLGGLHLRRRRMLQDDSSLL